MRSHRSPKLAVLALAAALAGAGAVPAAAAAAPSATDPLPAPPLAVTAAARGFTLEWGPFSEASRADAEALRRSGAIQRLVKLVNRRYSLPREIPILFSDETDIGPAYFPNLKLDDGSRVSFIHFPGSFIEVEVDALAQELAGGDGPSPQQAMIYANEFVVAHEIGHALVHQLDLPITGREEDAVDGFAAHLLTASPNFGSRSAFSAALLFDAIGSSRELQEGDFADEHSLPEQRVYQFLCWIYGSDKQRYRSLVGDDGLPPARAGRCVDEWRQINRSWKRLLQPYAR